MTEPRRVSVVGNTGSGKSTLIAAVAQRLGVPHIELDALYHQPGWTALPKDEFRARVTELAAGDGWVIDGNFTKVRGIVWGAADTIVWLDLPRRVVMPALARRTLGRMFSRQELWNGNRESLRNLFSIDPELNILLWSWTQHRKYRERYEECARMERWSHLRFVRLRSRDAVQDWLESALPGVAQQHHPAR